MKHENVWEIKFKNKNKIFFEYSTFRLDSKEDFLYYWNNKKIFIDNENFVLGTNKFNQIISVNLISK